MSIKNSLHVVLVLFLISCNDKNPSPITEKFDTSKVTYAKSFSIEKHRGYTLLKVNRPWANASNSFTYLVASKEQLATMSFPQDTYDAVITIPVESLVATSTTHIPALESLGSLEKLAGFPGTQYISSKAARILIENQKIRELGANENLNTEIVLEMKPNLIVGFGIDNQNRTYEIFGKAGIPVVYNGDWTEETPLGKAEWIKFFGVLLDREKEADSIFKNIEMAYLNAKMLAEKAKARPTVLSGALYKDVWYLPAGQSWAAQFISDANANYIYNETEGSGSLSLSLESVLEKGTNADFWIAPSQFTSYVEMEKANSHYLQFNAFNLHNIYTFADAKGETGGLLYYELAPQRPDIVLKDLIQIFHPELLSNHTPVFFTPLQ